MSHIKSGGQKLETDDRNEGVPKVMDAATYIEQKLKELEDSPLPPLEISNSSSSATIPPLEISNSSSSDQPLDLSAANSKKVLGLLSPGSELSPCYPNPIYSSTPSPLSINFPLSDSPSASSPSPNGFLTSVGMGPNIFQQAATAGGSPASTPSPRESNPFGLLTSSSSNMLQPPAVGGSTLPFPHSFPLPVQGSQYDITGLYKLAGIANTLQTGMPQLTNHSPNSLQTGIPQLANLPYPAFQHAIMNKEMMTNSPHEALKKCDYLGGTDGNKMSSNVPQQRKVNRTTPYTLPMAASKLPIAGSEEITSTDVDSLEGNTSIGDMIYKERRRKNNESAKRSRDAHRARVEETARRVPLLEMENMQLKLLKMQKDEQIRQLLLLKQNDQKHMQMQRQ